MMHAQTVGMCRRRTALPVDAQDVLVVDVKIEAFTDVQVARIMVEQLQLHGNGAAVDLIAGDAAQHGACLLYTSRCV